MKILFCKVSCMKYYKGHCRKDRPYNGGRFVQENGYGLEEYNFFPAEMTESPDGPSDNKKYCFGFVETKSTKDRRANELHIEKIDGCRAFKNEEAVDDVLVVWCATSDLNETSVVGWYKHATVYRHYQQETAIFEDRYYNILACADDCVLLPSGERHQHIWNAPTAKRTRSYGFGQSLVWYAAEESAKGYIERLMENIRHYDGENWLAKYPEP